jgi:UDPglucose 6-dehydrogenase
VRAGRLKFAPAIAGVLGGADIAILSVGTPPAADGSADLTALFAAAREICASATGPLVMVTKSTVPVGTAAKLREIAAGAKHKIAVASNPEFLKEGDAVNDFLKPDRIVLGTDDRDARAALEELYRPLMLRELRIIHMDAASAELTKYAANAMLATRISFMNELAALCEKVGASIDDVRRGIASDSRIGKAFLYAGVGYGGSCFPKDVSALLATARERGVPLAVVQATDDANKRQRGLMLAKILARFGGKLDGKRIAVWGLAFKPRTDDIREAPAIPLIEGLLAAGAQVVAYDRAAMENARARFGEKVKFAADEYAAVDGAHAVVLVTEWPELRNPDWDDVKKRMAEPNVFDGRNIYVPELVRSRGFTYVGIGRA